MQSAKCAFTLLSIFLRKRAVLISLIPALLGAGLSSACVRVRLPELLMIGRLLTGINCGTSLDRTNGDHG